MVVNRGDMFRGLVYTMAVALVLWLLGRFFIRDRSRIDMREEEPDGVRMRTYYRAPSPKKFLCGLCRAYVETAAELLQRGLAACHRPGCAYLETRSRRPEFV